MTTVRNSRSASIIFSALTACVLVLSPRTASAHRLDELLQAARIDLRTDRVRVELDLTPGSGVSDQVARQIDQDADGVWSSAERAAFADRVGAQLTLQVDGEPVKPSVTSANYPDRARMASGQGAIALELSAEMPRLAAGGHRFYFRNDNDGDSGAYLANALVPEDESVRIGAQHRDGDQREIAIEFTVTPWSSLPVSDAWNLVAAVCFSLAFVLIVVLRMPKAARST